MKFKNQKLLKLILVALLFFVVGSELSYAQFKTNRNVHKKKFAIPPKKFPKPRTIKEFIVNNPTIFELGWTVIDDDGKPFKSLFQAKKSWNIRPFPTRAAIEKQINNFWYIGTAFSYSLYKKGKIINNREIINYGNFFSIDVGARYDINELIGKTGSFDPFATFGLGFTNRVISKFPTTYTANLGFGMNYWFIEEFLGISIQSQAKFGLHKPFYRNNSNYLQHSISLVFKTNRNLQNYTKTKRFNFRAKF